MCDYVISWLLGQRYYVTFALWHELSVCRLSVCLSVALDVVAPYMEG